MRLNERSFFKSDVLFACGNGFVRKLPGEEFMAPDLPKQAIEGLTPIQGGGSSEVLMCRT